MLCVVCLRLLAQVWLRAQRSGNGRGRMYRILYTAGDEANELFCDGVAYVCVPHDASPHAPLTITALLSTSKDAAAAREADMKAVARAGKFGCPSPHNITEEQWMATQQEKP